MKIPFFGISRNLSSEKELVTKILFDQIEQDFQLLGPKNQNFERILSLSLNRKYSATVGSGTDALYFALKAIGVKPGDEVLVTAVSFIASAMCILRAGATPVFVDVHQNTLLMNIDDLMTKITSKSKAIVVVHLFGQMIPAQDMERIKKLGLLIVEDAAQALGASNDLGPAGSFGSVSCLSFDPTKILFSLTSGGAVLTDDLELINKVKAMKFHGRDKDQFTEIGGNSQLAEFSAGFLAERIGNLNLIISVRKKIAEQYLQYLSGIKGIDLPVESNVGKHTWQKFVILAENRELLINFLKGQGIETKPQYSRPLFDEPIFEKVLSTHKIQEYRNSCPGAVEVCRKSLGLPIYPGLLDQEIKFISEKVRQFYNFESGKLFDGI